MGYSNLVGTDVLDDPYEFMRKDIGVYAFYGRWGSKAEGERGPDYWERIAFMQHSKRLAHEKEPQ